MEKVLIIENAKLPAMMFLNSIQGITFKNTIYTRHKTIQGNYEGVLHLIHELVHIQQIHRLDETEFAARYGEELLMNRGYSDKMPLENEAYCLVRDLARKYKSAGTEHNKGLIYMESSSGKPFLEWLEKRR